MIKEFNFLRAAACLSIVMLHSTTQFGRASGYPDGDLFNIIRILLCFATPVFIVLSEIILANRYNNKLPKNFFGKRIKWIIGPYLFFAVVDALVRYHFNPAIDVPLKIFNNIFLGSFIGWFIIIIFQFYILHYAVVKWKISMNWLLPISYVVMFSYSYIITLDIPAFADYGTVLHLPFLAWFGYFTTGFVIGKHYSAVSAFLHKNWWVIALTTFLTASFIIFNYFNGYTLVNSRRLDLLPFTISFALLLLTIGKRVKYYFIINRISAFSFGIYLVHWQVQRFIAADLVQLFDNRILQLLSIFFGTLIISIIIVKMLSVLPYGEWGIGKVKKPMHRTNSIPERKLVT
ncbi:acyltransferase family protein [Jeotgalibacillus proteolyticus]|uniref:acyltransferase family protein n=1 Tax=Jeotgalibacillus proteolyticus TaxID=2082395 RepID=UPI003CFB0D66